jgi:hypothetical protein
VFFSLRIHRKCWTHPVLSCRLVSPKLTKVHGRICACYLLVRYDSHGIFSSPRALFMFRAFGHQNSSILDGGLPEWQSFKNDVETESDPEYKPEKSTYPIPEFDENVIRSEYIKNSFFLLSRPVGLTCLKYRLRTNRLKLFQEQLLVRVGSRCSSPWEVRRQRPRTKAWVSFRPYA